MIKPPKIILIPRPGYGGLPAGKVFKFIKAIEAAKKQGLIINVVPKDEQKEGKPQQ